MVVFTCQHCSSSLKKSAVEKHYAFKCRNVPFLTCIDCLKDFKGDEYVKHISCISEAERYGGEGYVAKSVAAKQNEWLKICSSVLENSDLSFQQKNFLKLLVDSPNLPRDRNKFHNFVKNKFGYNNYKITMLDSVFDVLHVAYKQHKQLNTNSNQNDKKSDVNQECKDQDNDNQNCKDITESVGEGDFDENQIKEKRKKKKKKDNSESNEEKEGSSVGDSKVTEDATEITVLTLNKNKKKHQVTECSEGVQPKEKKNKKKNKNKEIYEENGLDHMNKNNENVNPDFDKDMCVSNAQIENNTEIMSKKERKKKLKQEKYERELKALENSNKTEQLENEENINDFINEDNSSKKKRKGKHLKEGSDVIENKKMKTEEQKKRKYNKDSHDSLVWNQLNESDKTEESSDPPKKFNWEEVILQILNHSSDKEMSLKRLRKKVVSEYQFQKGSSREDYEKILAKFSKKIVKTVGVRVLRDRAKLISCE